MDEAKLLQGRCGQGGLVALVADEDDAQVPAGDGGMPPLARGIAAPFQRVAGHHDGAGYEAVFAPLVVAADVDEQSAAGLGVERLGRRWAAWQRGPGVGEQVIDGLRGAALDHVGPPDRVVPSRLASPAPWGVRQPRPGGWPRRRAGRPRCRCRLRWSSGRRTAGPRPVPGPRPGPSLSARARACWPLWQADPVEAATPGAAASSSWPRSPAMLTLSA